MARCEDYPCCGHTPDNPCPRTDKHGRIIPTCCFCGKRLLRNARSSMCGGCLKRELRRMEYEYD